MMRSNWLPAGSAESHSFTKGDAVGDFVGDGILTGHGQGVGRNVHAVTCAEDI